MRVSLDISRRENRKRNTMKKVELEGGIGQRNAWKRSRHDVTSEYDESRKVNVQWREHQPRDDDSRWIL